MEDHHRIKEVMELNRYTRPLIIVLLALITATTGLKAQYEEAAIKELLREAYENGYYNSGIVRNLELGFSPDFREVTIEDGVPRYRYLPDWIQDVNNGLAKSLYPAEGKERYSIYYHRFDISGDLAHIKVNLKKGGKPIALEYIEVYKSPNGWLILSMTRVPMQTAK